MGGCRALRHDVPHLDPASHQRVVREILCETDVAHHPHEPGNDLGGFNPPDGVDRAMGVGGRHGPDLKWGQTLFLRFS